MKKILASVAAAGVLAAPALVAGPAVASPYVPVTPTTSDATMVKLVYTPAQHPQVRFIVKAAGGRTPHGTVYATVRKISTGKVTSVSEYRYHSLHPRNPYTLPRQAGTKAGARYRVILQFVGNGFQNTRDSARFIVKK